MRLITHLFFVIIPRGHVNFGEICLLSIIFCRICFCRQKCLASIIRKQHLCFGELMCKLNILFYITFSFLKIVLVMNCRSMILELLPSTVEAARFSLSSFLKTKIKDTFLTLIFLSCHENRDGRSQK